jgi:hypothetical protein
MSLPFGFHFNSIREPFNTLLGYERTVHWSDTSDHHITNELNPFNSWYVSLMKEITVGNSLPSLYNLLTFQVPDLINIPSLSSFLQRIHPNPRFYQTVPNVYSLRWMVISPTPPPNCENTPCRLSPAAYSMYSQLTSIAGGRPSVYDPRTRLAVVTNLPDMGGSVLKRNKLYIETVMSLYYSLH